MGRTEIRRSAKTTVVQHLVDDGREPLMPRGTRWAGKGLSAIYGAGVKLHRAIARRKVAPIATLCIGNITVGGTGKTPATIYVARELARRGRRPAILMRGYKAQGGDEAEEVKTALSGLNVPVILGSDRHAGTVKAAGLGCDVALLDDGFQHWRLARDLDIVLIDATDPFGGGSVLPRGRLREPLDGLARAGVLVLTRAEFVGGEEKLAGVMREFARHAPTAPVVRARHAPAALRALSARSPWTLERLRGLNAVAACGIGNPRAFWATLKEAGVNLLDKKIFRDHHVFDAADLVRLARWTAEKKAEALLVTEKDAMKIEKLMFPKDATILALRIEFQIDGAEILWEKIDAALRVGDARRAKAGNS